MAIVLVLPIDFEHQLEDHAVALLVKSLDLHHVQGHYWVMQLDHVPTRGRKSFTISLTYTSGHDRRVLCTRQQLLAEISKCDVVCANCHAERTHRRGGQRWGKIEEPPFAAGDADTASCDGSAK